MGHLGQTAALCAGSDCLQQLNYWILCASIAKMCRSKCGKPMNQTHSDPLWQQWSYVPVFIFTCQSKLTDILAKFMSLWCSWIKHAIPLLKGSAIKPGLYSQSISVCFITSCGCLWFTQLMWNPFCDISAYVSTALVTIYWSHCYVPLVFEITYLDVGAKIICVWDFLQMFQTMKKMCLLT